MLSNVAAVAAGSNHAIAVMTGGSLKAWGGNYVGQLGDGTTNPGNGLLTLTTTTYLKVRAFYSGAPDSAVVGGLYTVNP